MHFVTEMCTDVPISVSKWHIVGYGTSATLVVEFVQQVYERLYRSDRHLDSTATQGAVKLRSNQITLNSYLAASRILNMNISYPLFI